MQGAMTKPCDPTVLNPPASDQSAKCDSAAKERNRRSEVRVAGVFCVSGGPTSQPLPQMVLRTVRDEWPFVSQLKRRSVYVAIWLVCRRLVDLRRCPRSVAGFQPARPAGKQVGSLIGCPTWLYSRCGPLTLRGAFVAG